MSPRRRFRTVRFKDRGNIGMFLAFFAAMFLVGSAADADVGVRQGRHGHMGRLVFDFAGIETFHTELAGNILTIRFAPPQPMGTAVVNVPGVHSLQGGDGFVRIGLTDGAVPRVYRIGTRVVVDATQTGVVDATQAGVVDATQAGVDATQAGAGWAGLRNPAPAPAAATGMPRQGSAGPKPAQASPPPASPLPASPPPALPPPAFPLPAAASVMPPAAGPAAAPATLPAAGLPPVNAAPLAMPAMPANAAVPAPVAIDFNTQPGAAAFRRGNQAIIVFDTPEIPDIGALQSAPAFASAALVSLQDAQIITLPLPASEALALSPVAGGWQVAVVPATLNGLAPVLPPAPKLELPMPSANRTATISDPLTGNDLLVGTVLQSGAEVDFAQAGPGFSVLPAWLGVAILPEADDLGLNTTPKGFELSSTAPGGLRFGTVPAAAVTMDVSALGQNVNLPTGGTAALRDRMLTDLHAAATLAPLGRLSAQIALAADMIALGLGPDAKGVLDTAVLENPAAADNGQIAGMRAVAGVLAGKYNPADFKAPGIVPSPDLSFWQAAGQMAQGQTAPAAPVLAAGLAAFEAYPAPLRNAIAPQLAETLADAGLLQPARQLVDSDPANPALDLARAKILEREGQIAAAHAAYLTLSSNGDFRISAIAADREIELELATGRIDAARAADRLDAALFDWRDPEHERHMRLRIAELRARAGQWQQAFNTLQAARNHFTDQQSRIDTIRSTMFVKMLSSRQFTQLAPIQAVSILQQNQDLIPAGDGSVDVINLLAQRLDALDLPGAAAPMLSHLIQSIPPGVARATLGARLAQVDLDAGSPVATLADLAQTQADGLPPALAAQRAILNAKAEAAGGNAVAAVTNLAPGNASASNPVADNPPAAVPAISGPLMPAPASLTLPAGSPPAGSPPTGSPPAGSPPTGSPPMADDPAALETQAQIAEQSGQWPQAEQALSALVAKSVPAKGPIAGDPENTLLRLATAASHDNDTAMLASLAGQYGARVGADPAGQMFQTLTTPALSGDQGLNQALHEIAQLQALPAMLNAVAASPPARTQSPGTSARP